MRYGAALILALLATIAVCIRPSLLNTSGSYPATLRALVALVRAELGPVDAANIVAAGALFVFFRWRLVVDRRPFDLHACVLGGVLSLFLVTGQSLSTFHDFTFITLCSMQSVVALEVFAGYWALLYHLLVLLFGAIDAYAQGESSARLPTWMDAHFWATCTVTLLVCWGVQIAPFFPGSVPFDGNYQLNMYFGAEDMTLHHPYISTLYLGFVYSLGEQVMGMNGGVFLIVLINIVAAALIFGRICDYVRSSLSARAAVCCIVFYALAPMWWTYLQTVMKDTPFFIAFALFSLEYLRILRMQSTASSYLLLALSAAVMCLFRNNGIYIVLPSIAALLLISVSMRPVCLRLLGVLGFVVAQYAALSVALTGYLGLAPLNQVEAISVPLQQVARCLIVHGDDMTEEQRQTVERIIDTTAIEWRYNPVYADPVKDYYRKNISSQEFEDFFKLYVQLFSAHPLTFIEAAANHAFGYLDPTYYFYGLSTYQFYSMGNTYSQYVFPSPVRNTLKDVAMTWNDIPALNLVVSPAAYTWLILIVLVQLWRTRRMRDAAVLVAPFFSLLICFVSPVSGLLRYALPIMAAAPLYAVVMLRTPACYHSSRRDTHTEEETA